MLSQPTENRLISGNSHRDDLSFPPSSSIEVYKRLNWSQSKKHTPSPLNSKCLLIAIIIPGHLGPKGVPWLQFYIFNSVITTSVGSLRKGLRWQNNFDDYVGEIHPFYSPIRNENLMHYFNDSGILLGGGLHSSCCCRPLSKRSILVRIFVEEVGGNSAIRVRPCVPSSTATVRNAECGPKRM